MLARNRFEEQMAELLEGMFFKGSSGDADVTSRVEPWSAAKPHYERLYGLASAAYDRTDKNPYPGNFIARRNTYDDLAQDLVNLAAAEIEGDVERTRNYGNDIISGKFLDPASNPILVNTIDVAVEKAESALLEDVIPQVLDIAVRSGAYSGTATDIIIDRALEGFSREALRATTGIYYENYTKERAMQASGVEVLKIAEVMDHERSKLLMANADIERALEQAFMDNSIAMFKEEMEAHWRGLNEYMGIMSGGAFSETTERDPAKKKNVIGSALQGAVGGASLGASVGGAPGAGLGAILGGLASMLG